MHNPDVELYEAAEAWKKMKDHLDGNRAAYLDVASDYFEHFENLLNYLRAGGPVPQPKTASQAFVLADAIAVVEDELYQGES